MPCTRTLIGKLQWHIIGLATGTLNAAVSEPHDADAADVADVVDVVVVVIVVPLLGVSSGAASLPSPCAASLLVHDACVHGMHSITHHAHSRGNCIAHSNDEVGECIGRVCPGTIVPWCLVALLALHCHRACA